MTTTKEIIEKCKIIDPWGYKIILADYDGLLQELEK